MNRTEYANLSLPEKQENYSLDVVNSNTTTIDNYIKSLSLSNEQLVEFKNVLETLITKSIVITDVESENVIYDDNDDSWNYEVKANVKIDGIDNELNDSGVIVESPIILKINNINVATIEVIDNIGYIKWHYPVISNNPHSYIDNYDDINNFWKIVIETIENMIDTDETDTINKINTVYLAQNTMNNLFGITDFWAQLGTNPTSTNLSIRSFYINTSYGQYGKYSGNTIKKLYGDINDLIKIENGVPVLNDTGVLYIMPYAILENVYVDFFIYDTAKSNSETSSITNIIPQRAVRFAKNEYSNGRYNNKIKIASINGNYRIDLDISQEESDSKYNTFKTKIDNSLTFGSNNGIIGPFSDMWSFAKTLLGMYYTDRAMTSPVYYGIVTYNSNSTDNTITVTQDANVYFSPMDNKRQNWREMNLRPGTILIVKFQTPCIINNDGPMYLKIGSASDAPRYIMADTANSVNATFRYSFNFGDTVIFAITSSNTVELVTSNKQNNGAYGIICGRIPLKTENYDKTDSYYHMADKGIHYMFNNGYADNIYTFSNGHEALQAAINCAVDNKLPLYLYGTSGTESFGCMYDIQRTLTIDGDLEIIGMETNKSWLYLTMPNVYINCKGSLKLKNIGIVLGSAPNAYTNFITCTQKNTINYPSPKEYSEISFENCTIDLGFTNKYSFDTNNMNFESFKKSSSDSSFKVQPMENDLWRTYNPYYSIITGFNTIIFNNSKIGMTRMDYPMSPCEHPFIYLFEADNIYIDNSCIQANSAWESARITRIAKGHSKCTNSILNIAGGAYGDAGDIVNCTIDTRNTDRTIENLGMAQYFNNISSLPYDIKDCYVDKSVVPLNVVYLSYDYETGEFSNPQVAQSSIDTFLWRDLLTGDIYEYAYGFYMCHGSIYNALNLHSGTIFDSFRNDIEFSSNNVKGYMTTLDLCGNIKNNTFDGIDHIILHGDTRLNNNTFKNYETSTTIEGEDRTSSSFNVYDFKPKYINHDPGAEYVRLVNNNYPYITVAELPTVGEPGLNYVIRGVVNENLNVTIFNYINNEWVQNKDYKAIYSRNELFLNDYIKGYFPRHYKENDVNIWCYDDTDEKFHLCTYDSNSMKYIDLNNTKPESRGLLVLDSSEYNSLNEAIITEYKDAIRIAKNKIYIMPWAYNDFFVYATFSDDGSWSAMPSSSTDPNASSSKFHRIGYNRNGDYQWFNDTQNQSDVVDSTGEISGSGVYIDTSLPNEYNGYLYYLIAENNDFFHLYIYDGTNFVDKTNDYSNFLKNIHTNLGTNGESTYVNYLNGEEFNTDIWLFSPYHLNTDNLGPYPKDNYIKCTDVVLVTGILDEEPTSTGTISLTGDQLNDIIYKWKQKGPIYMAPHGNSYKLYIYTAYDDIYQELTPVTGTTYIVFDVESKTYVAYDYDGTDFVESSRDIQYVGLTPQTSISSTDNDDVLYTYDYLKTQKDIVLWGENKINYFDKNTKTFGVITLSYNPKTDTVTIIPDEVPEYDPSDPPEQKVYSNYLYPIDAMHRIYMNDNNIVLYDKSNN